MNENNFPNIDGEENVTPAAEEITEVVEEVAEEVLEEVPEAAEAIEELSQEDIDYVTQQVQNYIGRKSGVGKKIAVIVVSVVAALAVLTAAIGAIIGFDKLVRFDDSTLLAIKRIVVKNPYNEMGYINVSGRTIADVAAQAGMGLDEFLAEYSLPADMPADTEESAAYYNIPISKFAQMYGMDTEALRGMLGLGIEVTDDTPWGEAESKAKLGAYIGVENVEAFKEEYGLGDEVTAETLWGEIRNIVDSKTLEMQKSAAEEAKNAAQTTTGDENAPEEAEQTAE